MDNIPVYIIEQATCDPRKCTARKLLIKKKARRLRFAGYGYVVLYPYARHVISKRDIASDSFRGIVAVDCSWNNFGKTWGNCIGKSAKLRALPYLVPANPINYGKPTKLSTAESLASALYILGKTSQSRDLLSTFNWGDSFFALNEKLLNKYAIAKNSEEIILYQNRIMGDLYGNRASD